MDPMTTLFNCQLLKKSNQSKPEQKSTSANDPQTFSRKWILNPWTIKSLWLNDNGDHMLNTRPENVLHSPPLSEGEGLACRVLQVLFYISTLTYLIIVISFTRAWCLWQISGIHIHHLCSCIPGHTCECALTYLLTPMRPFMHLWAWLWPPTPSWPRPSFWPRSSWRCPTSHPLGMTGRQESTIEK